MFYEVEEVSHLPTHYWVQVLGLNALQRLLFELNLPPTASILDKVLFQEAGMMIHNHIVIHRKIEVVSHDFFRIPYEVSSKGPSL